MKVDQSSYNSQELWFEVLRGFSVSKRDLERLCLCYNQTQVNILKPPIRFLCAQLSASPVATLGVVPDGVTSLESEPLRHRTILLHLLAQESLQLEALHGTHDNRC